MILAAVGKNGTGKDFFLDYVAQKYGFPMISIGDVVRELATKDGLELTRDNLHATSKKYMGEIFRKAFGDDFILVDVVISDDEVRYQRMIARGSERDGKSVEKLRENDLHEEEIFHTSESEKMANYVIKNDGGVEDFYAAVDNFYETVLKPKIG